MKNWVPTSESKNFFNYSYGRYFSMGVLALVTILMITGIYFLLLRHDIVLNMLGFSFVFFGFCFFIPSEIFQINLETKQYRNVVKIFNYTTNPSWKDLSRVQYLSVVNRKSILYAYSYKTNLQEDQSYQDCVLRFFIKAGYTIDIDEFKNKRNALLIGSIIAKGLNLQLLDATVKPSQFVELENE